jgi:hypothetical protein
MREKSIGIADDACHVNRYMILVVLFKNAETDDDDDDDNSNNNNGCSEVYNEMVCVSPSVIGIMIQWICSCLSID